MLKDPFLEEEKKGEGAHSLPCFEILRSTLVLFLMGLITAGVTALECSVDRNTTVRSTTMGLIWFSVVSCIVTLGDVNDSHLPTVSMLVLMLLAGCVGYSVISQPW